MSLPSLSTCFAVMAATSVAAAAAPGAASAATLSARPSDRDPTYETLAYYDAAPGERNDVRVTRIDDHRIRVTDTGATIAVGQGCRSIDAHTAECSNGGPATDGPHWFLTAVVAAGDLDDVVRSTRVGLRANGGPGDDLLAVDAVIGSELNGGGGRDELLGGDNSDTLIDGDTPGAVDADTLDGRGGGDTVSYAGRTRTVFVDLGDDRPDGEAGEGDVLRSVESAIGGEAGDRLRGQDGPEAHNTLRGGGGDDLLVGLGGRDSLDGGAGADRIDGGSGQDFADGEAGDDRVEGGRGQDTVAGGTGRDRLVCGAGHDRVANPTVSQLLEPDCEDVAFLFGESDYLGLPAYPTGRDRRSLTFRVNCVAFEDRDGLSRPISGTVRFREASGGRALLGRGVITRAAGRTCGGDPPRGVSVRVKLTARGRKLAARRGGVAAVVALAGRNLPSVGWGIRLRSA